ncbi:hypothetical protein CEXT_446811 [Caerostris extrusa]|uniref:Uncharacterized protein n=1 Tax=Caerostris extrusa TaxID=172846 RepID=A0AAV4SVC0_CAEEX|nr:hypothetical protein CEXT_446811 [Caerostris extrusa]
MGIQRKRDDEKMELKKATKNATSNCRMRQIAKLASALMRIYFAMYWTFIYNGFITCVSHWTNKDEIGYLNTFSPEHGEHFKLLILKDCRCLCSEAENLPTPKNENNNQQRRVQFVRCVV